MKLNTLYKSVLVEYASVAVLVRLIPTPDHELRLSDHYVRMRVVSHSLATYGANTTRSAVPLLWPTLKTCHSLRAYVELVVNGGRTLSFETTLSVDLRSSEITR